ncbi:thioredoxin-related protein [Pedobacter sp. AK017]|uniref:TlpA family protein disulfide reductase n=1 Tax=Pedobacter sp. AK017 TaxID=2723073 RepID=UPI001619A36C|nr:thioredoxin family protein [Pedobacter sp. AK017]MBB5436605.1 thioredoxin-related protein [Pedobacter sp. AK017]
MKKLFISIFLIFILVNAASALVPQIPNDSLKFSGTIKDVDGKREYGIVSIRADRNDGFNLSDSIISVKSKIDINGNFSFSLPNLGKPFKIGIAVRNKNGNLLFNKAFFTEPKDSIQIQIFQMNKRDSVVFFGRGMEKYNLINKLENQFYEEYISELKRNVSEIQYIQNIKSDKEVALTMEKWADVLRRKKQEKLNLIQSSQLDPRMKSIINFEFALYNIDWGFRTGLLYYEAINRKQLSKSYLEFNKEFSDNINNFAVFSPAFASGTVMNTILELKIQNKSDRANLKTLYDRIKSNYSGIIRDRLLGYALLHKNVVRATESFTPYLLDSLLKDATQIVKLDYVKRAFNRKIDQQKRVNNVKIIDAEFLGSNGKKISLKSLKGKVFLIDTWFNGCDACAGFHKVFDKEIFQNFKNNKDFVVLSINIDKDKERWKSGISSGVYSSDEYLNVSTEKWLDHPFFNYYQIQSAPYLMLVDAEGNIIYQPNGNATVKTMSEKISLALVERLNHASK